MYALRKAFGIPVGVGRILNADEVMTYRYDPSTCTWHFLDDYIVVSEFENFNVECVNLKAYL